MSSMRAASKARVISRLVTQSRSPNTPTKLCTSLSSVAGRDATLRIQTRAMRSTVPSCGIMDSIRGSYDEALKGSESKKEQKVFDAQMKYLTDDSKRINGDIYMQLMGEMQSISGMSGVKQHLPWVQNNPALEEFKSQEKILNAMTPAERRDVFSVAIGAKKRIAADAQVSLDAVESILSHVSLLVRIQKWLVGRKKGGLPMPKTSVEMQNMMMNPESGMKRGGHIKRPMANPGVRRGRNKR